MRVLIDSNVLLFAVNKDFDQNQRYRDFVERTASGTEPWCLTWGIVYEFLRVSTHPSVFSNPLHPDTALDLVRLLLTSSNLEILTETQNHNYFLDETYKAAGPIRGNIFHDCRTAALMMEHDVKFIATEDRHFRLFPFIEIVEVPG